MKTKITLFAFFSILFSFAQKGEYDLLKEHTQTKILYNQVFDISKISILISELCHPRKI